ncbi:hypothetical protein AB0958_44670 [Streptomyces sp. NPDC006655]|uniref:hypothetical protein n=1 Tax=Streptomyces sp. NPDC006655 TaxID=3156898 RepID=UPI0034556116
MLDVDAGVAAEHNGILLICDKEFTGRDFETLLGEYGITMLRPSRKDEKARYGEPMLKGLRSRTAPTRGRGHGRVHPHYRRRILLRPSTR